MATTETIRCPAGTYGLAVAPWSPTEVYAVAADWGQASDNVRAWAGDRWIPTQYQVADFRHRERDALRQIIEDACAAGGEDTDYGLIVRLTTRIAETPEAAETSYWID